MNEEKTIDEILEEELKDELKELSEMKLGTDEYKTTVDGITKLYEKTIELKKFEADKELKRKAQEANEKQIEQENKDRKVKNVLTGVSIGAPLLVTVWGTIKSLKFEQTGVVGSMIGRGFIQNLIPRKK